jgi:parallel beta-helix repeat protein
MDTRMGNLALLAIALLAVGPGAWGCALTINGDGNGGDVADAELTFDEARLIAQGQPAALTCLTQNELDQISGETSIPVIPGTCGTVDPRFVIVGGCGLNDADQIGFADGVGTITTYQALLVSGDSIDGRKPSGGRVTLLGDGTAGNFGLMISRDLLSTQPPVVTVRNLIVRGNTLQGIYVPDLRGTVTLTGLDVFDNGGDGIQLGTAPGAAIADCAGISFIGGSGAGEENFVFGNGGYGIELNDPCNSFDQIGATLFNNYVGLADPQGLTDTGNALGGISVFFARNIVIGGSGANQRNYIGWNDGPGLRIVNQDTGNPTRIEGNWIGMNRDLPGSARPNTDGVLLIVGDGIQIGGASTAQGNVISGNTGHAIIASMVNPISLLGLTIENNVIGLNPSRTATMANGVSGIALTNAGSATLRGNVVSGNAQQGVYIGGASGAIVFENNVFGLRGSANNANDNTAAGNGQAGIWIDGCTGCVIGPGNRIASNAVYGLRIRGDGSDGVVVRGNVIGLSNGASARPNGVGIFIEEGADDTLIGGSAVADRNTISANTFEGVRISGAGSDRNVVRNNRIGTDPSGLSDLGNGSRGVRIDSGAGSAEVSDNLISGNGSDGVSLEAATGTSKVQGNRIGLDAAGNALLNGQSGVALAGGTTGALIGGGATANIIAANANFGIYVADTGTSNNTLQGNQIGVDAAAQGNGLAGITLRAGASSNLIDDNIIIGQLSAPGIELDGANTRLNTLRRNRVGVTAADVAIPNAGGIRLQNGARDNTIGGASSGDRNIVSGNNLYGIALSAAGTFNSLQFNHIGLASDGVGDRGNAGPGVIVETGTTETSIRDNTISGNTEGVRIQGAGTSNNTLTRNRIGTSASGTGSVGNDGTGVRIAADASRNSLGLADSPGNANTIRFNGGAGVWVESGQENRVRTNAISNNGGLGIDLGTLGVTANDGAGDADTGANGLQNFPVLSNVVRGGGMLSMDIALTSAASTEFALNVYRNLACDPSGNGEGEGYVGTLNLTTAAGGSNSAAAMFPLDDIVPASAFAATATGFVASIERGTSEFSACAATAALPDPIFANGFESIGSIGAEALLEKRAADGTTIEALPDARYLWRLVSRPGAASIRLARTLLISSDRPVLVHSIRTNGAICEQVGAILCAIPEQSANGYADIAITFTPARGRTLITTAEDDGSGAIRINDNAIESP